MMDRNSILSLKNSRHGLGHDLMWIRATKFWALNLRMQLFFSSLGCEFFNIFLKTVRGSSFKMFDCIFKYHLGFLFSTYYSTLELSVKLSESMNIFFNYFLTNKFFGKMTILLEIFQQVINHILWEINWW